jgi:guanidinobutyrase
MPLAPHDELALLLRPAAGGVHVVSTGKADQLALQERLYGVTGEEAVRGRHREQLARIGAAKAFVLGVPSDVGAGYRRGANLGPQAIRRALLERHGEWWSSVSNDVVDLGDVFVVPQLLEDRLLSDRQLASTRRSIYPDDNEPLPVSPLTIERRVLDLLAVLNPSARPFVLGGDHSVAWPVAASLVARHDKLGIVQLDAHTDLLPDRLGIPVCFATWAFHANDALGRGGRLVQLGVRASGRTKEHWESTLGVRQIRADECLARGVAVIDEVVAHFRSIGVERLYLSNDIDGTDASEAMATGTPEPGGLPSSFVLALIEQLRSNFDIVGADIVEVAPPLGPTPEEAARTVALAADYAKASVDALLTSGRRAVPEARR